MFQGSRVSLVNSVVFLSNKNLSSTSVTATTASTPPATSTAHPEALDNPKSKHTGAIAGAAVGAAVFALIISAGLWYFLRKRRPARNVLLSPREKETWRPEGRRPESLYPAVVPYDISEHHFTPPSTAATKGGTEFEGHNSNGVITDSGYSPPMVRFAKSEPTNSQGTVLEGRRSHDSGMQESTVIGTNGPTSPDIVGLLQAIVARYPSESGSQAPPSYYVD